MKTIDIFRKAVNIVLDNTPGLLQKTIALKLNDKVANSATATSDFNDFLKGRKNYSLAKQERLATILGYSYIDLLNFGRSQFKQKITNLNDKRRQRKILLRNGTSCTYEILLKMVEQVLLENGNFDIQKSILIESIVEKWKELQKIKRVS